MLGRFIQPDSIVPEPGNPQSLNRYTYVLNNPLRYADPSGHMHDPSADYRRNGAYSYYNLSSHPDFKQQWFQERSLWITYEGKSYWAKPSVADYVDYLRMGEARSSIQPSSPTAERRSRAVWIGAWGQTERQHSETVLRAAEPEVCFEPAPPKTLAGYRLKVEVDWSSVDPAAAFQSAMGVIAVGVAKTQPGSVGEAADKVAAALGGWQAGVAGSRIIASTAGAKDYLQFGLIFLGVRYQDPRMQLAFASASLFIDLFPDITVRTEEDWR